MKIIILQENLKEALLACGKAVASSSSLPILNSFLLRTSNGFLEVTATNLEMSITHTARCRIEEDGEVCLQARSFQELVGNLPNETITLSLEGSVLKLSCGKIKTSLNIFTASDFPRTSLEKADASFLVNSQDLSKALKGTLFAVSNNETQAELCGVCIKGSEDGLVFAGTNRYRLAEMKIKAKATPGMAQVLAILPARAGSEMVRFSDAFAGEVKMGFEEGRVVLEIGATTISSRLISGHFPDYLAIVPSSFTTTIKLGRVEFLTALKTMMVFARNNEGLSFAYKAEEGTVELSASNQEAGSGQVEVAAGISGDSDKVLFNFKYLHDVVSFLSSEEIVIKLNNPQSPVVIEPLKSGEYLYLVMPIKL
jgi:DNA polymerase-3 subunit beta